MDNLTAIAISFLRPKYTIDCIRSLRRLYPNINISVGEQTKDKPTEKLKKVCSDIKADYKELPYDCGVGNSRNMLIEDIDTDYVLVGDDDFLYDDKAKIKEMLTFMENTDFDLIGGRILENGRVKNYQGYIEIYDDHIKTTPIKEKEAEKIKQTEPNSGLRYKECDLTFNFFIIRTETAKECAWDENIKVAYEHHHFFTHLKKAGKKVAFSPDPIVKHKYQDYPISREYKRKRMRRSDKLYYLESLDIDYIIGISGAKVGK